MVRLSYTQPVILAGGGMLDERMLERAHSAAAMAHPEGAGAVIAAEFGDVETAAIARDALARHYPGREVVMLNTDPLGELGGGIHCATQQQPVP